MKKLFMFSTIFLLFGLSIPATVSGCRSVLSYLSHTCRIKFDQLDPFVGPEEPMCQRQNCYVASSG